MSQQPPHEPRVLWDSRKAASIIRKHGVSFGEAATVLRDWLAITKPDPDHKLILVAHTDEVDEIRIISARLPTRSERSGYEDD